MEKNFNLSRYKELIEREKNGEISFLNIELLNFRAVVGRQISYERKKDYFTLIDGYLNGIISLYKFRSKFLQMEKEDSKQSALILENFQELEGFAIANDLENFSASIGEISTLCLEYYEIWDENTEPMSESEFYSLVNNHYLQLQKFFPF